MSRDPLDRGSALDGRLFRGFLEQLAAAREPELGERIGPWRIVSELGRGGSGVVFLAERADGAFSQQAALKWLRGDRPIPGGRDRLARERELLASLDHPHIARLIDGGQTDDGFLWFAMDYAAGKTIDRHCRGRPLRECIELLRTICSAVDHAHRRGLIHGDIKPSNLLVDARGEPRLVDFGISRLNGAGLGSSYGLTPDYASPEQRAGDELTTASDIWQLGRLLARLIDSRQQQAASGDRVPADLQAIVDQATARHLDHRYASVAALASDLDAWLADRPVGAHRGGPVYRLHRLMRRNRALSMVVLLALAVIIGGGVWMTWQLAVERDRALAETRRAEVALVEAESALARADALGGFLSELLEATRPTRPAAELPTTEEILERGARRALDPDAAPPAERFDMLSTIGKVYRARSRYDDAEPLLAAALELARQGSGLSAADHARALEQRARLMIAAGDSLDQAEVLLLRAEGLLAEVPEPWPMLARVRITRTWVERHRGRHDRALALVEPIWWQMPARADPSVRGSLFDSLAGLHAANGDIERSARFRDLALEALLEIHGETGQGYVVALANSVGVEISRGNFDEAERRARKAIDLYDRIYEDPVDYRAVVRRTLARLLLITGRIDAAFAELDKAGDEHGAALGWPPGQWPLHYSTRGHFNVRLGRYGEAVADLERAAELMDSRPDALDPRLHVTLDLLLAWSRCRHGLDGQPILEAVENNEALLTRPREQNLLVESRSTCQWQSGAPEAARRTLAPLLESPPGPGNLIDAVDRRLLMARILAELGRPDQAARALKSAERAFADLGLANHPVLDRVRNRRAALQDRPSQ